LSLPDSITIVQSRVRIGDPQICSDSKGRLSLVFSIYEALVRRGEDGSYQPALAESWSLAEDARSWTFKLRDDITCHNGEKLRARDVVASLDRVRGPSLGGELGTEGVYASYIGDAVIEAPDEATISVVTPKPMADLLDLIVEMPIAPESALENLQKNHVGTGPYRIEESDSSSVVVKAFPGYWGGEPPVKEVRWLLGRSSDERVELLLSGEADIAAGLSKDDAGRVESSDEASVFSRAGSMCIIFMFNCFRGSCTDRRVRRALNYALDKREIVQRVLPNSAEPLMGVLTPLHLGYDPKVPGPRYDPEKAMRLLADAGYPSGLTVSVDKPHGNSFRTQEVVEIMEEMYSKVGVTLDVSSFPDPEQGGYSDKVRSKDIGDMCWFDSSPLSTFRVMREKLHSDLKGPWWEGYTNTGVDRLIEEASATVDTEERRAIYSRIYRKTSEDPPWVFLYRPLSYWGIGSKLRGWEPGVDGLVLPWRM